MTPPLGHTQFHVLLALFEAKPPSDTAGVDIIKLIAAKTGHVYSEGHIYTALSRLHKNNLVSSQWTNPKPIRGGRRKRCYALTPAGTNALRAASMKLKSDAAAIPHNLHRF